MKSNSIRRAFEELFSCCYPTFKHTELAEKENLFESCSPEILVKIMSFQDPEDIKTSRLLCQRFDDIIHSNARYIQKKSNCEIEVEGGRTPQGRKIVIAGRLEIVENEKYTYFQFLCTERGAKLVTQRILYQTFPFSNLKTSFQFALDFILRHRNIKYFQTPAYYSKLTEEEIGWGLQSFKKANGKISVIYSEIVKKELIQLANATGCNEFNINYKKLYQPCLKQLFSETFVTSSAIPLEQILYVIKEWANGYRNIYYFQFLHDNAIFTWDVFFEMFDVVKNPQTARHQLLKSSDRLEIGRFLDDKTLQLIYIPPEVGNTGLSKIVII